MSTLSLDDSTNNSYNVVICVHVLASYSFPTVLVCMLVRTTHEVREDMGPLVVMVMCSTPSEDPFTLIVRTSDGSAVGEQMSVL